MHTSITNEQLVNFVLNDVNSEESKRIIEAINSNPLTKERYLLEKRKNDVDRYIHDEMDIGECCEIEELIKMDSRLYEHFESNTETIEEEQDVSVNVMHISITNEQLVDFVLNNVNEEEYKKISEAIKINSLTKERYLFEKRKNDIERYINDKMDFGERCEIEELLKIYPRLQEHLDLKKGVVKEEDLSSNFKHIPITKEQLVNFILNDVKDEEYKKISEAIDTKSLTKEKYLFEKRKCDVERYIEGKMDIGERCEIEELIKTNPELYEYFELNNGIIEEKEQDESVSLKQINITNEQLIDFVLNDVNKEEQNKIIEAINTNPLTKERFLFEKRKHDIDRYLEDEMNIAERCEIEELIKINSRLYEHFELNKDVNVFLEKALKDQLNNIHEEIYNTFHNKEAGSKDITPVIKLKNNALRIGKWIAAASIVITVGLSSRNIFLNNKGTLEESLYNSYYEPFRNNTNDFFNSTYLIEAKRKYNNKEYDVAWVLINNLPNSLTIEAEKIFYAGLTLIELENYTEAINKFKLLQANKELVVINSISQWYLALCYLKIEKRAEAIAILEKIVDGKSYNHSEAKKILKKLG